MRFRNQADTGFTQELKQRVKSYLETAGDHRYANLGLYVKGIMLALIVISAYIGILVDYIPILGRFFCAVIYGASVLLLAINIGHDAAHNALTRNPLIDRIIQRIVFTLLGVDAYLWRLRHVNSHHLFPNVNGCDIDIDNNPFLRLSPNQPWRWYFRYQYWYAPLVYCLVVYHTVFIQDFLYLYQRQLANLRDIRHPPGAYIAFYVSKLMYLFLIFVIPVWFANLTWLQVILGYSMVSAVASLLFIFLLVGTHFSDRTQFPIVNTDGTLSTSWAVHSLMTSQDWNPQSPFASFVTGGANCHAAHHLFPRLSHRHYRKISVLIQEVASQYGIRYIKNNFTGMVLSHFRFLRLMSVP